MACATPSVALGATWHRRCWRSSLTMVPSQTCGRLAWFCSSCSQATPRFKRQFPRTGGSGPYQAGATIASGLLTSGAALTSRPSHRCVRAREMPQMRYSEVYLLLVVQVCAVNAGSFLKNAKLITNDAPFCVLLRIWYHTGFLESYFCGGSRPSSHPGRIEGARMARR